MTVAINGSTKVIKIFDTSKHECQKDSPAPKFYSVKDPVYVAACGIGENALTRRTYNFMGAISYPLYITHYPVMYLFYAWLIDRQLYTFAQTWPVVIGVVAVNIAIAWLLLKFYDEPVRRWLTSCSSLTVSEVGK